MGPQNLDTDVLSKEHRKTGEKIFPNINGGYFRTPIVWKNAMFYAALHLASVYGVWLMFTAAKIYTILWAALLIVASDLGMTAGVHRLFSHRSYKAKWPLRLLLTILQTIAGQYSVYTWVKEHRQHHKYSDTDADPCNASRGFFFSHVGWLIMKRLPEVKEKAKLVDRSDLEADPIVMFQYKYYFLLYAIVALVIPVAVPCYLWGESFRNSLFISYFFRYVYVLNAAWFVNSAAHMWGYKSYEKDMLPVENQTVTFLTFGEGWHNFHHTFPWDYRAAEYGLRNSLTTKVIDFFASIGWAYDLKSAIPEMVKARVQRTGDGSHPVWGWGDKDIAQEEWNNLK